jgi:hypothetical protein
MRHRPLIFFGFLSLAAVAYADPAANGNASASAAGSQDASALAIDNRNCVKDTGSMIQRKDGCTANGANSQSYDQDDVRRTGATSPGGAIRDLVPGATVGR